MAERRPVLTDPAGARGAGPSRPPRSAQLSHVRRPGERVWVRAGGGGHAVELQLPPAHAGASRPGRARSPSADRRQRPWRATITGFTFAPDADPSTAGGARDGGGHGRLAGAAAAAAARLPVTPGLPCPAAWREVDLASNYTLRITPDELRVLGAAARRAHPAAHRRRPRGRPRIRAGGARPVRLSPDRGPMEPRGALSVPAFRALWAAGLISDTGDWLLLIALPIVVYQLTGSALGTSAAFAAELGPGHRAGAAGRAARRRRRPPGAADRAQRVCRRSRCCRCCSCTAATDWSSSTP